MAAASGRYQREIRKMKGHTFEPSLKTDVPTPGVVGGFSAVREDFVADILSVCIEESG